MQIEGMLQHVMAATRPNGTADPKAKATGQSDSSSSDPSSQSISSLQPNDFMTLLIAQIQAQDPTNPMDPTTFVNQLVSFNTLEQVMQINSTLSKYVNPPASTDSTSTTGAKPSTTGSN